MHCIHASMMHGMARVTCTDWHGHFALLRPSAARLDSLLNHLDPSPSSFHTSHPQEPSRNRHKKRAPARNTCTDYRHSGTMASFHMRGRDFSARELVSRTMSPRIAVVPSQGVTELCQLNNIPSLVDLLKPFAEQMEGRGKNAQTEMKSNGLLPFLCMPFTLRSLVSTTPHSHCTRLFHGFAILH